MKKISIIFFLFILLFTVSCSLLSKKIRLSPQEKIEKLEQELRQELKLIKEEHHFQLELLAQDIRALEGFVYLLESQQDELREKTISPFIPESVIFCGEEIPLDRFEVRERLEWALMYEMDRWAMVLVFLRSGRWFPMIEQKIRERNLPEDLKYIVAVESDLNPEAVSSAGAVGLWQFIEDTAERLCGLRVDSYIDERYDFEKATEAALEHLKELHIEFRDWLSALAGYNMNKDRYREERIKERALDFYSVKDIPLQTLRYPFLVIATKLIMENPEKYNYPSLEEINKIKYKPYSIEARLITVTERRERIVDIAQRLGMTYQEFRVFNPHILIGIKDKKVVRDYLPRGEYRIYVKTKKDTP